MALPKSLPRSVASPPKRLPLLTHLRFLLRPISLTSHPALAFFALTILPLSISAQTSWTPIAPPTTQNLWSVTNGLVTTNGVPSLLFVAVGEAGTILTSPTGESGTWTLRTSGTTRWLTSVAYVTGQFIAVGEHATVLVSPDGLTWTPRTVTTNPNAPRLNALAYGNGTYLAVSETGESFSSPNTIAWQSHSFLSRSRGLIFAYGKFVVTGAGLVATSYDGATSGAATNIGLPNFLESVTYARHTFVTVGAGGLVLTSATAERWTAQPLPATTATLRGVAFFNHHFVAVGEAGTILTSPDALTWTPRPLAPGAAPLFTAVAAGETVAIAVGHHGAIYRSTPSPAAPVTIVTAPRDLAEFAGSHVEFSVIATGPGPLSYQWSYNGQPIAGATGETLLLTHVAPASAGRYEVTVSAAGTPAQSASATLTVAPFLPSVTSIVDPTFVVTPALTNAPATAVEQPDGKILLGGHFTFLLNGTAQTGLARLNPDGSLDSSFTAGSGVAGGAGEVTTLALQSADGKILVGGSFTTVAGVARLNLARLHANGTLDSAFVPSVALSAFPITQVLVALDGKILAVNQAAQLFRLNPDGSLDATFTALPSTLAVSLVAPVAGGKILVAGGRNERTVLRLNADGSVDASFPTLSLTTLLNPLTLSSGTFDFLRTYDHDRIAVGLRANGGLGGWAVSRFNADGSVDPTASSLSGSLSRNSSIKLAIDDTGQVITQLSTGGFAPPPEGSNLTRYGADGYTFRLQNGFTPDVLLNAIVPLTGGKLLLLGNFTAVDGTPRSFLARTVVANAPVINAPAIAATSPQTVTVRAGESVTLRVTATGTQPFTSRPFDAIWFPLNSAPGTASADGSSYTIPNVQNSGLYYARISNPAGSVTGPVFLVVVEPTAPRIVAAPAALSVNSGRTAVFTVDAPGSDPRLYQWFFDRTPVGTNSPTFTVNNVTAAHAGTYTVVVRNALGTATSAPARLTVDDTSRLANLATRGSVGTGENVLTTGFVLRGPVPRTVLIRGIGPGLTSFGVTGTVPNPSLALFDSVGTKLAENDDWNAPDSGVTAALFQLCGAFPLANGSADAALVRTLAPGAYTVQVSGASLGAGAAGTTGLALAEIYEADALPSRLVNLSSRLVVGEGASVAIPGVVIAGTVPRQLLIRAVGPALAPFGVTGFLADPRLTLTAADGTVVAANDDWSGNPNAAALVAATASVGAFALSPNSRDAALLVTVPPGSYTAQVTGSASTTGLALVEVYEVP